MRGESVPRGYGNGESQGLGPQLSDYEVPDAARSARIFIPAVDGPRFVPGDFAEIGDLIADVDTLFSDAEPPHAQS